MKASHFRWSTLAVSVFVALSSHCALAKVDIPKSVVAKTGSEKVTQPLPVGIYRTVQEDREETRRANLAEKREALDLDAQQRSANAAETQIWLSFAAAFLSFISVVVLFFTIRESKKTTAVARDTAQISKETNEAFIAAERAVLLPKGIRIEPEDRKGNVFLSVRNFGANAAYLTAIHYSTAYAMPGPDGTFDLDGKFDSKWVGLRGIEPGRDEEIFLLTIPAQYDTKHSTSNYFIYIGAVEYKTLNKVFRSPFSFLVDWRNYENGMPRDVWEVQFRDIEMPPF